MTFKKIKKEDYKIDKFEIYPEQTFTQASSGSGIQSFEALKMTGSFETTEASYSFGSSSIYKRLLYDSLNHMFYANDYVSPKSKMRYYNNELSSFNSQTSASRRLHDRAYVISIPQKYYGYEIKPGSVTITCNSGSGTRALYDDENGNLWDSNITSGSVVGMAGLYSYWTFDEESGTIVYDQTPHQNSGSIVSASYSSDGIVDYCLVFDGTNDYVDMNKDFRRWSKNKNKSVSLWVKPATGSFSTEANIFSTYIDNSGNEYFGLRISESKFQGIYRDTYRQQAFITDTNAIDTGSWTNMTLVQSYKSVTLYNNGTAVASASNATTPPLAETQKWEYSNAPLRMTSSNATIGARHYGSTTDRLFSGSIDEVRLYNKTLSATNVSNLYSNPSDEYPGFISYEYGIASIHHTSSSYDGFGQDDFTVEYKSTYQIVQNEVSCEVLPGEMNAPTNPTAFIDGDADNGTLAYMRKGELTDQVGEKYTWNPYITTVGLYDDEYNLVAVGKLSRAIQKQSKVPMNFVIKWDM